MREKVNILEKVNNLEVKMTYFRNECTNPENLMVREKTENSQGNCKTFYIYLITGMRGANKAFRNLTKERFC